MLRHASAEANVLCSARFVDRPPRVRFAYPEHTHRSGPDANNDMHPVVAAHAGPRTDRARTRHPGDTAHDDVRCPKRS